jgi:HAD superfamily hydrolase (TIGR01484 family)
VLPLSSLSADRARAIRGLLFDLDDTLLTHGVLTREAYGALWALHDHGLRLVAVTGRPSGWGEVLVRQWPIDGAVTENGAVHVVREETAVVLHESCSLEERAERRARLDDIVKRVREAVPEAGLADDVLARRADVTWDIGERVQMPKDRVDRIADVIVSAGARTTRSSVHIHATLDPEDKASGTLAFLSRVFGDDPGSAKSRYAFVGDSGNDSACFAAFALTFGVSNVSRSLDRIAVTPKFVTTRAMGEGFAELAGTLIALREGGQSRAG